jgi:hypothetical protein
MSAEQKQRLHDYLAENREAMTWKAESLSEYDVRNHSGAQCSTAELRS